MKPHHLAPLSLLLLAGCEEPASTRASASGAPASAAPRPSASAALAASQSPAPKPSDSAAAPPEPPAQVGELVVPEGPLVLQVGAAKVAFKTAILYAPFGAQVEGKEKFYDPVLHLVLSTSESLDCAKADHGKDYMDIELGPGPDGTYFSGKEIATTFFAYAEAFKAAIDDNRVYVEAPFSRLRLAAFKPSDDSFDVGLGVAMLIKRKDKVFAVKGGGHVKVQICKDRNKESFDGAVAASKLPPPKAGAVSGTVGGKAFQAKSALAMVTHDKVNDVDVVESIGFFAADAKCEDAAKDVFSGGGVQGVGWHAYRVPLTSKARLTGLAVPLSLGGDDFKSEGGRFKSTSINFSSKGAWIRIDEASLEEGGLVKGALVADSGKGPSSQKDSAGRLDGTFSAKVCKRK